jgi:hypothetical protein
LPGIRQYTIATGNNAEYIASISEVIRGRRGRQCAKETRAIFLNNETLCKISERLFSSVPDVPKNGPSSMATSHVNILRKTMYDIQ